MTEIHNTQNKVACMEPCLYCDCHKLNVEHDYIQQRLNVVCQGCGIITKIPLGDHDPFARWNNRPRLLAKEEKIADLENEIRENASFAKIGDAVDNLVRVIIKEQA